MFAEPDWSASSPTRLGSPLAADRPPWNRLDCPPARSGSAEFGRDGGTSQEGVFALNTRRTLFEPKPASGVIKGAADRGVP